MTRGAHIFAYDWTLTQTVAGELLLFEVEIKALANLLVPGRAAVVLYKKIYRDGDELREPLPPAPLIATY